MDDRVPKFCSVCGKELVAKRKKRGEGFDPHTGEKLATTIPMLVCPERGNDAVSDHDRWEKRPDENMTATWEKWDG